MIDIQASKIGGSRSELIHLKVQQILRGVGNFVLYGKPVNMNNEEEICMAIYFRGAVDQHNSPMPFFDDNIPKQ